MNAFCIILAACPVLFLGAVAFLVLINNLDVAKARVQMILRDRHHLRKGMEDDFEVTSVKELSELAVALERSVSGVPGAVAPALIWAFEVSVTS